MPMLHLLPNSCRQPLSRREALRAGFLGIGARIHGDEWFVNLALISPLDEAFLKSDALGIPFLRIGKTF